MTYSPRMYLLLSSTLIGLLPLPSAFANTTDNSQYNSQNIQLTSGTFRPFYHRGVRLCNQVVTQKDWQITIDYQQPCTLSETNLQCDSIGYCIGTENDQRILVHIIHDNHYIWENVTQDYGGSFLRDTSD